MNRRIRRTFVISGVTACLLAGAVSIRVAADMTAAAAPPPAPPVSMESLRSSLVAEQARGATLQSQLDDLLAVTDQLTAALSSTEGEVKVDGLTAKQLRDRLKAADAKLKAVNRLLLVAQHRLAALGAPVPTLKPAKPATKPATGGGGGGGGGGSGGGGGGGSSTPAPTTAPTPRPTTFSLTLALVSGRVRVSWTTCSANGFDSYAVVRSGDPEIHYPPEDLDTLVARITDQGRTSTVDAAPSGSAWYRVYCLTRSGGETRTSASTSTVRINVP